MATTWSLPRCAQGLREWGTFFSKPGDPVRLSAPFGAAGTGNPTREPSPAWLGPGPRRDPAWPEHGLTPLGNPAGLPGSGVSGVSPQIRSGLGTAAVSTRAQVASGWRREDPDQRGAGPASTRAPGALLQGLARAESILHRDCS